MRTKSAILACSMLALLACQTTGTQSHSGSKPHPLQGDWELVSGRFTRPDGTVSTADSSTLRSLKVIGASRFSFVTVRADGSLLKAAAGRYTVSGNTYTEHIDLVAPGGAEGSTAVFTWRVEGDTWYHNGESRGMKFDEVWRRVR